MATWRWGQQVAQQVAASALGTIVSVLAAPCEPAKPSSKVTNPWMIVAASGPSSIPQTTDL